MEKGLAQSRAGYLAGRRTILIVLMLYSLILGIVSVNYLYVQNLRRVTPQNASATQAPMHVQNIRDIVQNLQAEKSEFIFKGGMQTQDNYLNSNINNSTLSKKISSLPSSISHSTTHKVLSIQNRTIVNAHTNSTFSNVQKQPIETPVVNTAIVNEAVVNKMIVNTAVVNEAVAKQAVINEAVVNTAVVNEAVVNTAVVNNTVVNIAILNNKSLLPPVQKEFPRPSVLFRYKSMRTSKPFENHCKKCAIVSSSGQLLGNGLGPEIDSYPCVIRMNTAPVRGFEKDVGRKTTIRVSCFISTKGLMSTPSLFTGEGKPEKVLMWGLHHQKNSWALRNAKSLNAKYRDVEFFAQEQAGEVFAGEIFKEETGQDRAKTNTWLSTGWFTMMVALDMCDEIHIYGMIPEDFCLKNPNSKVKYHYYQVSPNPAECSYYKSQEGSSRGGHRFMTEKAIFERWGRRYNMTFHNPVWDLSPRETERKIETPFMQKYAKKGR
ncbi:alpha-N-acetylgalactosaminide alpha-2,6-sialyltransferase 6-like [Anneissia japonica]|uniref:alpha-N-acetylgalactosaminide alpha-2,6-sialyltransferase 6-like n=1 Tax=Anneissia japonica TaxID=1529436 RepID=UPI0014254D16|nr:alpha-N-acetylgalactosaminide alpha-2,6-sialyltransferase 6-like [Anneissia japonica]XP_033118190.1 alpha-N-acetylgalactosaminide alpha-2,6-sialyltransferase 6-like [Anneissia japonica]